MPSPSPEQLTPQLTLLDVKNHLCVHFLQKAVFNLTEDIDTLKLGASYDDHKGKMYPYKKTLIANALDSMVKSGHLIVLDAEQGVCMLTQPLGLIQTVQISPYTAHLIAEAFNFFARSAGETDYVANKLAICDTDINTVAQMCFSLRDQVDELHNMIEMDDEDGGIPGGDDDEGGFPPLGCDTPENN